VAEDTCITSPVGEGDRKDSMHATGFGTSASGARFFLLLMALAASLQAEQAKADAFPDTIYFDGFEACGLQCARVLCPGNGTTSLSGTIYAPEGTLPLPNVEVYIANATVAPLVDGPPAVRCDQAPSGHPLVATLTGSDGKFKLVNVPAGTPMNLVVLAGKWRRQVAVPALSACVDTPLDPVATRLPRDHTEGDIAHIALVTGSSEALECLMRKSGVADSEFTTSAGSGRIHLYAGSGGANHFDVAHGGATFTDSLSFWTNSANLAAYDQVIAACGGAPNPGNTEPQTALDAMRTYADSGGRAYFSHLQNYWLSAGAAPWNTIATWNPQLDLNSVVAQVNSTFAQGSILSSWLSTVGATATPGTLSISGGKQTATALNETLARKWIYLDATANLLPTFQYFTFTTPAEAAPGAQKGRVLFTEMHSSPGDSSTTSVAFPSGGCTTPVANLTPQDHALLYGIFDLQRCVGSSRE
jgi:hypothetical protein